MKSLRIILYCIILVLFIFLQNICSYSSNFLLDKTANIIDKNSNVVEVCLSVKQSSKTDIILLIDKSASISKNNISKHIKNACKQFIELALKNTSTRIAVISFSSTDNVNNKGCNEYADVECSYTDKKSALNLAIDNIKIEGQTNLAAGFAISKELIEKNSNSDAEKYVILFTDGVPNLYINNYTEPYSASYSEGKKLKENCTIITVGYFNFIDKNEKIKAVNMLNDLSDKKYYDISNASLIESTYKDIYGKIYSQSNISVEDKISDYFIISESSINALKENKIEFNKSNNTIIWQPEFKDNFAELKYIIEPNYNNIVILPQKNNIYYTNEFAKVIIKTPKNSVEQFFPKPFVKINNIATVNATSRYNPMTSDIDLNINEIQFICIISGLFATVLYLINNSKLFVQKDK